MRPRLFDAHNHLQDDRLAPHLNAILDSLPQSGVARMVVNGSSEADWQMVSDLAKRVPQIIPSFGYHPWYVNDCSPHWEQTLNKFLDAIPSAIGEIGLDRWIKTPNVARQEEVFVAQLRLAAERNLPISVHCLQAWGRLLELLEAGPRPSVGFVLHSFGGPREMIDALADLGAYFSLPGYFAHERKQRQRETFRHVPRERLLIETDAPDQLLPPERTEHALQDASGKPINDPRNIGAVYRFAAELLDESIDSLAMQVETNFMRVFGKFNS